ncbi:hypothetical protein AVEN_266809-1 [Araneus ventricosus]|uniref:Uncharacterized protein n=1 Tax=Araneus ventricosus TaxID=182803 RepID=A0A4Y2HD09_ARAVE|nr:hypothetical protein AVEN_266809-1 [Araneus ventricosus]
MEGRWPCGKVLSSEPDGSRPETRSDFTNDPLSIRTWYKLNATSWANALPLVRRGAEDQRGRLGHLTTARNDDIRPK